MSREMVKLDDCLQLITYGFTNPMPDSEEGPWKVTAKDIIDGRIDFTTARHTTADAFKNDLTDKSRPIRDDILLTKDGTLGRLAIVGDETICINQSVALLRLKKELLLPRYLFYLLQSPEYQGKMLADAGGSTIKHIYITKVNQLMIPVPSLEIQQKFINILFAYDRMVDNCKEQIKLLEEAAQRLYKEWFVDLRFPGHETTPIVDGVPEGWERNTINSIIDLQSGFAFKSTDFCESGTYKIVTIKNVQDGLFDGQNVSKIDEIPARMPAHCRLGDGDVLLSLTGNVGRVCVVNGQNYLLNQRVAKIKSDYPAYAYCLFRSSDMFTAMGNLANGAAQQNLSPIKTGQIKILIPPFSLLIRFEETASAYMKQMLTLNKQIELLQQARDRLLPKLMSGEIEV